MDCVVDALRLSRLCAPRDMRRINPGLLLAASASAMEFGWGMRVCGEGERSETRSDTARSDHTDLRGVKDGDGYVENDGYAESVAGKLLGTMPSGMVWWVSTGYKVLIALLRPEGMFIALLTAAEDVEKFIAARAPSRGISMVFETVALGVVSGSA